MFSASSDELEKLRKLRTELENRLAAIDEELETLEGETEVVRQKVAIRELEESVRRRQEELAGLRFEKKRFEEELDQP
jgi:predicted  nucleic acid-binding Zn-ribbon protein